MALLILFFSGYNMAVPGEGWAVQLYVVHGLFLQEALLVAYLLLFVASGSLSRLLRTREALPFAALIALLGVLGIISSSINPYRWFDLGQAGRLFLHSAQFLLAVHWCRTRGTTFVLRWYLLGIAVGGVENLYFTFSNPYLLVGILPALKARSGAGGMLALGIGLGAWLLLIRRNREDTLIAATAALVGIVAGVVSFSKTTMTIGACGLVAWMFVLAQLLSVRRLRLIGGVALAGVGAVSVYEAPKIDFEAAQFTVERIWDLKFAHFTVTEHSAESARYMYNFAVAEILTEHPFVGVGSSGFYDAIVRTDAYKTGLMDEEDPDAKNEGTTNPHNTFLYFASANGFPGLIIVLVLFGTLLEVMRRALSVNGLAGRATWFCMVMAYFLWAVTLPNLFTTAAMYFPAAVALATTLQRRSELVTTVPATE